MSEGAAAWAEKIYGPAGSHTAGANGAIAENLPTVTGGRRRTNRRTNRRQRKQRKSQRRRIRGGRK